MKSSIKAGDIFNELFIGKKVTVLSGFVLIMQVY